MLSPNSDESVETIPSRGYQGQRLDQNSPATHVLELSSGVLVLKELGVDLARRQVGLHAVPESVRTLDG